MYFNFQYYKNFRNLICFLLFPICLVIFYCPLVFTHRTLFPFIFYDVPLKFICRNSLRTEWKLGFLERICLSSQEILYITNLGPLEFLALDFSNHRDSWNLSWKCTWKSVEMMKSQRTICSLLYGAKAKVGDFPLCLFVGLFLNYPTLLAFDFK